MRFFRSSFLTSLFLLISLFFLVPPSSVSLLLSFRFLHYFALSYSVMFLCLLSSLVSMFLLSSLLICCPSSIP